MINTVLADMLQLSLTLTLEMFLGWIMGAVLFFLTLVVSYLADENKMDARSLYTIFARWLRLLVYPLMALWLVLRIALFEFCKCP